MGEFNLNNHIEKHYNEKYAENTQDKVEKINAGCHPVHRNEAAVLMALGGTGRLLEIGSGNGQILLSLEGYYQECVGIELSSVRAEASRKLLARYAHMNVLTGNFETMALPFKEGYFDAIISVAVIEHVIDPFHFCERMYHLLKPGGKVIVDTPNLAKWTRRIKLLCGRFPSTASLDEGFLAYDRKSATTLYDEGHFHYFTFRSLRKTLERAGFKQVKYHGYGKNPLVQLWPTLFSECLVTAIK